MDYKSSKKYVNVTFKSFFLRILYSKIKFIIIAIILSIIAVCGGILALTKIMKYITKKQDLFLNFISLVFLWIIVNFIFTIVNMFNEIIVRINSVDCKKLLFNHLLQQESFYFFNLNEGHLVGQITQLSDNINKIMNTLFSNLYRIIKCIVYIILISKFSLFLGFLQIIYLTISFLVSMFLHTKIINVSKNLWSNSNKQFDYIADGIKNILARKTLNLAKYESDNYSNLLNEQLQVQKKMDKLTDLQRLLSSIIWSLGLSICYYFNYSIFLNSSNISLLNYQNFYTAFFFIFELYHQADCVIFALLPMPHLFESAKMAFEILQTDSKFVRLQKSMPKDFIIQLNNVQMRIDNIEFLKKIQLTIQSGDHILIIGPSGSGKTTLCLLIMAVIKQTSGEITINNIPIMEISHDQLLNRMAYCPQNCVLYFNTIKFNITIGLENFNENNYQEAIKLCLVDEFLDKLPEKDLTNVGSGGNKLSGGQRQRVCLARAILRILEGADILILDEIFASLDQDMSLQIAENLRSNQKIKSKTILCIDHIGIWEKIMKNNINKIYHLINGSI